LQTRPGKPRPRPKLCLRLVSMNSVACTDGARQTSKQWSSCAGASTSHSPPKSQPRPAAITCRTPEAASERLTAWGRSWGTGQADVPAAFRPQPLADVDSHANQTGGAVELQPMGRAVIRYLPAVLSNQEAFQLCRPGGQGGLEPFEDVRQGLCGDEAGRGS